MTKGMDAHLHETLVFWQQRTKRTLTLEDAREIAENMAGFFEALAGVSLDPNPSPIEGGICDG